MRGKRNKPGGRIYNRYYNEKLKKQKAGVSQKNEEDIFSGEEKTFESEQDADELCLYLSHETYNLPDIESKWLLCQRHRLNFIKNNSTSNILKKWPSYKIPMGYRLVDIDYKFLHPCSESLLANWVDFEKVIISILTSNLTKPDLKSDVNELGNTTDKNGKSAYIFYLIHNLLPPTSKEVFKTPTGKKQTRKYTILDSQAACIVVVPTTEKLNESLSNLFKKGIPIQPFIIVTGESIKNPKEIIVYFDAIMYKLPTFVRALDVCFKLFQVFNLVYPPAAACVWTFIQKYFYKITTAYDESFLSVVVLQKMIEKSEI